MSKKIGRRRFIIRSVKAGAGATLARAAASPGVAKTINWTRAVKDIIVRDAHRWQKIAQSRGITLGYATTPEYLSRVDEFIADILRHTTLEIFVKLRGIGYLPMEYDMWQDVGFEYWEDFASFLAANIQYMR